MRYRSVIGIVKSIDFAMKFFTTFGNDRLMPGVENPRESTCWLLQQHARQMLH